MAPMFSAAVDSNRSAPRPAQSPTLSPTRSAITAGLRGSSSGMPASTLPTRSAPTSAALGINAAAKLREQRHETRPEAVADDQEGDFLVPQYPSATVAGTGRRPPIRLMATTNRPDTAPPRSAMRKPSFRLVRAARRRADVGANGDEHADVARDAGAQSTKNE